MQFFFFFFLLSPMVYFTVSVSNDFKRTDYPGKEIARLVQNKWDDNFKNEIKLVIETSVLKFILSFNIRPGGF